MLTEKQVKRDKMREKREEIAKKRKIKIDASYVSYI